jgi:hypothetical protein
MISSLALHFRRRIGASEIAASQQRSAARLLALTPQTAKPELAGFCASPQRSTDPVFPVEPGFSPIFSVQPPPRLQNGEANQALVRNFR